VSEVTPEPMSGSAAARLERCRRTSSSEVRRGVPTYRFAFAAAGTYKVSDASGANTGSIKVPVIMKPKSGGTGTSFTVTRAHSVPVGFDFDVQIKRPASTKFVDWKPDTVATSAPFVPDSGLGSYQFRARTRRERPARPPDTRQPRRSPCRDAAPTPA
jgi:hypothetical protein